MALQKGTWTDPNSGAVYPNVYLRAFPPVFDPEGNNGQGEATITLIGYANRAARIARKQPLFRWTISLSKAGARQPDGSLTVDVSDVAMVVGAPVGGATALPRYNQTMKSVYDWLKDPANAARIGLDLADATDPGGTE